MLLQPCAQTNSLLLDMQSPATTGAVAAVDAPHPMALPFGHSLLQGQYQIDRQLMAGGFGITYLARDSLDRQIVIKECFPAGFCVRNGASVSAASPRQSRSYKSVLRHFLREAQWLARASHENIVGVHQVFKENNTAYIAMECIEGCDLVTLRADHAARINQPFAAGLLLQALNALSAIHARGILHRDVSPDNFLVDAQDHLTLIDFGAACGTSGEDDTALGAMLSVKDGYSPHEFYQTDMPQRNASDLYALGATFYFLVTGAPPVKAQDRLWAATAGYEDPCPLLASGSWPYEQVFLEAIDKAMSILPGMRFQSAEEWLDALPVGGSTEPERRAVQTREPGTATPEPPVADVQPGLISDLVARTNETLTPRQDRADAVSAAPEPPVPDTPKQMVDMFGQPIQDIDAWLATQDQQARRHATDASPRPAAPKTPKPSPDVNDRSAAAKPTPRLGAINSEEKQAGWKNRVSRFWSGEKTCSADDVNGKKP